MRDPTMAKAPPLYRLHELAYRTQYAEIKERANTTGDFLRGTPGTLYKRAGTGHEYWYRVYYAAPKKQSEEFVGPADDLAAHQNMVDRIAFSEWMLEQVRNLRKLGYQVADKDVASVLVELHNLKLFEAGLVVVGTLAYMSWLNEYGAIAVAARTQDIDLARRQRLKLATPISFLSSIGATQLPFTSVPGMPSHEPSTSTVPYYDYMLEDSQKAVMLAGGCCIPIRLPRLDRMIWHKLHSSIDGNRMADKREKDLVQAVTLATLLVEQDGASLKHSFSAAPATLRAAGLARLQRIQSLLAAHPQTLEAFGALSK